jgi:hypothetical protein
VSWPELIRIALKGFGISAAFVWDVQPSSWGPRPPRPEVSLGSRAKECLENAQRCETLAEIERDQVVSAALMHAAQQWRDRALLEQRRHEGFSTSEPQGTCRGMATELANPRPPLRATEAMQRDWFAMLCFHTGASRPDVRHATKPCPLAFWGMLLRGLGESRDHLACVARLSRFKSQPCATSQRTSPWASSNGPEPHGACERPTVNSRSEILPIAAVPFCGFAAWPLALRKSTAAS